MPTALMPEGRQRYYNNDGTPCAGGKLWTYAAGTTNLKAAFTDEAGATPHENPLTLDAHGEAVIYWSGAYKVDLKQADGQQVTGYPVDNIKTDPAGIWGVLGTLLAGLGAALIGFIQDGVGAVARTLQAELRDSVKVTQFGVVGNGTDEFAGIQKAWAYCLANRKNLHFPAGTYSSGVNNMPFKNPDYPATGLLDCHGITIYGDGPATVLMSDSVVGADVLNVYSCKNLHFRNLGITARLPAGASGSGSNGISVVGGFDNVTFDGIFINDLPYVDKASYLDGGKALTIQPGTPATECGTLKASRIFANNCVYGAGLEVDLVNWGGKKHAIDIDLVAENCYQGVIFSAGEATGALSNAMSMGYRVRAQLVNCQRNVFAGRAHGVDITANIVTTKSAGARRLNQSGVAWNSVDSLVDGLYCTYAKDSRISIYGDVGECDYKAQVGGVSAGASTLGGDTEASCFNFDMGGQANVAPFNVLAGGGYTIRNSAFYFASTFGVTLATLPAALTLPASKNTVTVGPTGRMVDALIAGELQFPYTDGVTVYHKIKRNSLRLDFSASGSSDVANVNYGFLKHDGTLSAGFRNDGGLVTQGRATAASVTTVKQVMPIYDNTGAVVGYVPIYQTYA